MKKFLGILAGIVIGWAFLQWLLDNPEKAAETVNKGGDTAGEAGSGFMDFVGALSIGGILFLAAVIVAFILSRRK